MTFEIKALYGRFILFIRSAFTMLNEKVAMPVKKYLMFIFSFLGKSPVSKKEPETDEVAVTEEYVEAAPIARVTEAQWKVEALDDFRQWLSEIPSEVPPAMSATPDSCDLYSMMSEFTAMREEIRAYNREQHRTVEALGNVKGVTDEYGEIYTLFKEKTNQIAQLEHNIRLSSEKRVASSFFDVRDALVKGYRESLEMASRKGFFRSPPKDIHLLYESYEDAIARFDRALSLMDIEPILTDSMLFNPDTMKLAETRAQKNVEDGTVIETLSGGFARGREVLRYASVIVAQSGSVEKES